MTKRDFMRQTKHELKNIAYGYLSINTFADDNVTEQVINGLASELFETLVAYGEDVYGIPRPTGR